MPVYKTQNTSSKLNLTASFDQRTNNELLNIEGTGYPTNAITMFNLENSSAFYDGALTTRNGSITLSQGLAGQPFNSSILFDVSSPQSGGTNDIFINLPAPTATDYPALIYIPSGVTAITSGTIHVLSAMPFNPGFGDNIVTLQIYQLDTTSVPASGLGFMSGSSVLYNIAFSGVYQANTPPFPGFLDQSNPVPSGATPIAIAENVVHFDNFQFDSGFGDWRSNAGNPQEIDWKFSSPVYMASGACYAIRYSSRPANPSFSSVNVAIQSTWYSLSDLQPNVRLVQLFEYIGPPANKNYALRVVDWDNLGNEKYYTFGKMYGYISPTFLNPDDYSSSKVLSNPIKNSNTQNWFQDDAVPYVNQTASMGQHFVPASGEYVFFGAYFYPTPYQMFGNEIYRKYNPITGIKDVQTGVHNIGISAELLRVISSSGSTASGTYFTNDTVSLAVGSGNMTIDLGAIGVNQDIPTPGAKNNYYYPLSSTESFVTKPNFRENKKYILFNNPVDIQPSGTDEYIIKFNYFNLTDGSPFDIYQQAAPFNSKIFSAMGMGIQENDVFPGGLVINPSGNDWNQFSGSISSSYNPPDLATLDLNCGLIQLTSGSAITLVNDYRNADKQTILYGQSDKLFYSTFENPEKSNWVQFHSGAAIGNNFLWSAATMKNLVFLHQDSQSDGQVWTSDVIGSGINSYAHGKRPFFTLQALNSSGASNTASGSTIPAGTYNFMLATSMQSGGFRSSEPSGITVSGNQWIQVNVAAPYLQYPFDLNPQATYVFMTEAVTPSGGAIYYAPVLYDRPGFPISGVIVSNPVPNNFNAVFINAPVTQVNNPDVPTLLEPPRPQRYLTSQIDTPRFTKIKPFYSYLIGIGASGVNQTSTMFYSEINSPQIWGTAGDFDGGITTNPEDGDAFTSFEVFQQFGILFKKNSTYRVQFLTTGGIPFETQSIDNSIGNLGTFSTAVTPFGVYGLSQLGPILCDGNVVTRIGDAIYPWFATLNHNDLENSVAIHNQAESTISWSIGSNNVNQSRNFGLIYNYRSKSYIIRRSQMWNCGNIVRDKDNFDQIWLGDVLGQVKRDDVTNTDSDLIFDDGNGTVTNGLIQMIAETPWMSFSDSALKKSYRFLSLNTEQAIGSSLNIEVYLDYATTPAYTRNMKLDVAKSDNRINLGGSGKIVKFKIYNIGEPNKIKINKLNLDLQILGPQLPSSKNG